MNILLTDVRSLTLDIQEIPVAEQANADSFSGLLQQHFPADFEGGDQVVEFKGFLESFPVPVNDPEDLAKTSPATIWREFLARDQIKISSDQDPVISAPSELTSIVVNQAQATNPVVFVDTDKTPVAGQFLPVGGNLLPENALNEAAGTGVGAGAPVNAVTVAATSSTTPATMIATAGTETVTMAANSIEAMRSSPQDLAAIAALSPPDGKVTRSPQQAILTSQLPGIASQPVSGANLPRDFISSVDTAVHQPMNLAATKQLQPGMDAMQIPGTVGNLESEAATAIGSKPSAAVIRDILPARDNASVNLMPVRDKTPGSEPVLAREVLTSSADNPAADPRDIFKLPQPGIKVNSEATQPEATVHRSFELPSQTFANSSQQTVVSGATATPAVSTGPNSPPATPVPNALPAQLESMSLAPSADSKEWGSGLSERVNWMINQKQNMATIRLDPPALGKLDVHIKIADDVTTVTIQTQHAQTRELIEAASTRLRDFLQESGYQNVNVDVSQRQDQQQARSQAPTDAQTEPQDETHPDQASEHPQDRVTYAGGDGLVDTFA